MVYWKYMKKQCNICHRPTYSMNTYAICEHAYSNEYYAICKHTYAMKGFVM